MSDFDIFVSCPRRDRAAGVAVTTALEAAGMRCWNAARDNSSADWATSIVDAVAGCRVMVFLFSSNANASQQIQRELELALDRRIPIVAIRIENVRPTGPVAYLLASTQWLDAFTPPFEEHLPVITSAVAMRLQRAGASAPSASPRREDARARSEGSSNDGVQTTDFDAYISYAHRDRAVGEKLFAFLQDSGLHCWRPSDIAVGASFVSEVEQAIVHTRAFVLIISPASNALFHGRGELELARTAGIPILPVRIEDVRPNALLAAFKSFDAFPPPFETHLPAIRRALISLLRAPQAQPAQPVAPAAPDAVPANAAAGRTAGPAAAPEGYARTTPEYWLQRVARERKLTPGDQPLVLISFASEDQAWVDDLRAFLDPKIELLRDKDGSPYHLWNFSDAKRGTAPGDEFPEIVAEKMWRCRAALLVLSSSYFKSGYCKAIELPFLMWRRDHHKLICLPMKLGVIPVDRVRLPSYEAPSRHVVIGELIDDRQAASDFARSPYRDFNLRQLREKGIESEIENRFDGIARHVAEFLKTHYGAAEVE